MRDEEAGERLDKALAMRSDRSRAVYQRWIREGRVKVDGLVRPADTRLSVGQVVEVVPAPPPLCSARPQAIPLDILHEDEDLVVLVKPAGLVVHPAPGHPDSTLVNALVHRYGSLPPAVRPAEERALQGAEDATAALRPGIVHRLDAHTSGVMVVARTPVAQARLAAAFAAHDIERAYLAIAAGDPPAQLTFDTLHGRHPRDRKRFSSRVKRGRRARTHGRVAERFVGAALLRLTLETGRTHQIRVHCADHGFPLLGDPLYGRRPSDPGVVQVGKRLGRQALHAETLGFAHPSTGERLRFVAEPPADFEAALDALRAAAAQDAPE